MKWIFLDNIWIYLLKFLDFLGTQLTGLLQILVIPYIFCTHIIIIMSYLFGVTEMIYHKYKWHNAFNGIDVSRLGISLILGKKCTRFFKC